MKRKPQITSTHSGEAFSARASGQPAEGKTADEQIAGEHIDEGQIAERGVIGELAGDGHKIGILSVRGEIFSIFIYGISIYLLFL